MSPFGIYSSSVFTEHLLYWCLGYTREQTRQKSLYLWGLTSLGEVATDDEQKTYVTCKLCNILEDDECYKNINRYISTREIEEGGEAVIYNGMVRADWSEKTTLEQDLKEVKEQDFCMARTGVLWAEGAASARLDLGVYLACSRNCREGSVAQ